MKRFTSKLPIICLILLFVIPLFPLKSQGFSFLKSNDIQIFFVNPLENSKPVNACKNEACTSLLNLINNAKESIDFAIYGIGNQGAIFNALIDAQKRGVKLRGVTEITEKGTNPYPDTFKLMDILKTMKTDYSPKPVDITEISEKYGYKFNTKDPLMHNKIYIIDGKTVWTGSTNTSCTCMNYNSNDVLVINSPEIAKLYETEFIQMWQNGKFHKDKDVISNNENISLDDGSVVSVYFSPMNEPIYKGVVPMINKAQKNIDIGIFFFTDKKISYALYQAKKRSVKIRIILDAVSATNDFSQHELLRKEGIPVKVENWGGKMHMKTAAIDGKYLIIGSMNWTSSAQYHNDENTVVVQSPEIVKKFEKHFNMLWKSIPDKWLSANPRAESPDSPDSCSDDIDNDFNGLMDNDDPNCNPNLKPLEGQPLRYFEDTD